MSSYESPLTVLTKNSTSKFHIRSDTHTPHKIGLRLNTNVQLKSKRRFNFRDYINITLFCVLIGHGALTYQELKCLREEITEVRSVVDILTANVNMANLFYEQAQMRITQLENSQEFLKTKSEIHTVNKREADTKMSCLDCTNSTLERQTRAVSRGKHSHSKNRNNCRSRCFRTSGPHAVHLRGALPEITVRDGGIIAPWYVDKESSGVFLLDDGVTGEGRGIIEIVEEGLYFIYAQMYYLTSSSLNSYTINVQVSDNGWGRGHREDLVVAVCSAEAATSRLSELSCFTAVVRYLHHGDRIYLTQLSDFPIVRTTKLTLYRDRIDYVIGSMVNSFVDNFESIDFNEYLSY